MEAGKTYATYGSHPVTIVKIGQLAASSDGDLYTLDGRRVYAGSDGEHYAIPGHHARNITPHQIRRD